VSKSATTREEYSGVEILMAQRRSNSQFEKDFGVRGGVTGGNLVGSSSSLGGPKGGKGLPGHCMPKENTRGDNP